jgi:hypothetical protein
VRLDSQEVRINHLTAAIQELEDKFEGRLGEGNNDHDVLQALDAKLQELTGQGCVGQFSCGGGSDACVDLLQVCDGEKDCSNGHDEDDSTCSNPAPAGTRFVGYPVRDACTTRQPYELSVIITDTEQPSWFSNRVLVEASIVTRSKGKFSEEVANLPANGYYSFGSRMMLLFPPENDRLGIRFEFNTGDPNVVNAYVRREYTDLPEDCALFVLRRV